MTKKKDLIKNFKKTIEEISNLEKIKENENKQKRKKRKK